MRAVEEISRPDFIFEDMKKSLDRPTEFEGYYQDIVSRPGYVEKLATAPSDIQDLFTDLKQSISDPKSVICRDNPMYEIFRALLKEKHKYRWFDLGSYGEEVLEGLTDESWCDPNDPLYDCGLERLPCDHTIFTFYIRKNTYAENKPRNADLVFSSFCKESISDAGNYQVELTSLGANSNTASYIDAGTSVLEKVDSRWKLVSRRNTGPVNDITIPVFINFLKVLSCNNVKVMDYPASERDVRKARKANRVPPFTRHILTITGERTVGARPTKGGTHAAPRLHFRRGHVRQYAPGKYTWVTQTMVGRASRGQVHTDYKIEVNSK